MSQGVGCARCGSSTELHPAGQSRLAAAGASTTVRAAGTWMPGRTPDRGRHVGMRGGGQSREQLAVSMSQLVVRAPCVASWGVPVMLVPLAVAVGTEGRRVGKGGGSQGRSRWVAFL